PLPTLRTKAAPPPQVSAAPTSPSAAVTPGAPVAEPSVECPGGMELVSAGEFSMGSNDNTADPSEKPAHTVRLSAYCLDKTEVTARQFEQCVSAGKCARPAPVVRGKGVDALTSQAHQKECTFGNPRKVNHPINCVNWHQATAYC